VSPNGSFASWVKFISSALLLPIAAATLLWVNNINTRITVTEQNRWTSKDQSLYAEKVMSLLHSKQDKSQTPPPWFREDVAELKEALQRANAKVEENHKLLLDHLMQHRTGG
jgi:hypothetical protein